MKPEEIKVKVTFTEGYEKRFTEACLNQLRNREKKEASMSSVHSKKTA